MNILLLQSSAFEGTQATIDDTKQLHHIKTVLKAQIGDTLKIGQLGGKIGTGVLMAFNDEKAILSEVVLDTPPPDKLKVTVMLALPRPKVLRRLMMDMSAMGVQHIILVNSQRTDKSYWSSPMLARLDEFIIEGLQQGVDTIPPSITFAKRFKPFVQDELPQLMTQGRAVVLHPYDAMPFAQFCASHDLPELIIIGAEGGFIPYEIELLSSVGVSVVGLGRRILRTESAVNAVLGRYLS